MMVTSITFPDALTMYEGEDPMKLHARPIAGLFLGALLMAATATALEAQEPPQGVERQFTAQVVDVACYTVHDLKGDDHRMCAEVCADRGVSLVLLDSEGRLYHPVGRAMPSSGVEENQRLKPHAEQMVNVRGTVIERGGLRTIVIDTVTEAEPQQ
jgi:hypothetical protein